MPLFGVRSQVEQIDWAVRQERVFAWLASGIGLIALVLACLGVYGTLGYGVDAALAPEIGLRMALGATRWDVVSLILRESLAPVLVGAAIGVGLAVGTTRFVKSQLFEIAPRDPATLAAATIALVGAALLAAWLPSRRAASVDPVTALRCEWAAQPPGPRAASAVDGADRRRDVATLLAQQRRRRSEDQRVQLHQRPLRPHAGRQVRVHVGGEEPRRVGRRLPDFSKVCQPPPGAGPAPCAMKPSASLRGTRSASSMPS